jgi:hypothetical protein
MGRRKDSELVASLQEGPEDRDSIAGLQGVSEAFRVVPEGEEEGGREAES